MTRVNGFTLLELIFTLAILITSLSIGIPTFNQWIQQSKTTDLQYKLLHSIHYARSKATQLQSTITLCPGVSICENNWGKGILIFDDSNNNGSYESNETLLKKIHLGPLGRHLNWRSFRQKSYLQFNPQGLTKALNGTLHFCPTTTIDGLKFSIILSRTGRTRINNTSICH